MIERLFALFPINGFIKLFHLLSSSFATTLIFFVGFSGKLGLASKESRFSSCLIGSFNCIKKTAAFFLLFISHINSLRIEVLYLVKVILKLFGLYIAFFYIPGVLGAFAPEAECMGWQCKEVQCEDGYAVFIPEQDAYLPCEDFDQYINGDNSRLIKRK